MSFDIFPDAGRQKEVISIKPGQGCFSMHAPAVSPHPAHHTMPPPRLRCGQQRRRHTALMSSAVAPMRTSTRAIMTNKGVDAKRSGHAGSSIPKCVANAAMIEPYSASL
jgi:hypothetical protein